MISSLFHPKKSKRSSEDSEDIHCVPTLKRIRIWNYKEIEHNNTNSEQMACTPSFPIRSSLTLRSKNEKFMGEPIDMNDALARCSSNIASDMSQDFTPPLLDEYRSLCTEYKYMPDLNATENPHYYEYNKLLFELYVERIQRSIPESSQSILSLRL